MLSSNFLLNTIQKSNKNIFFMKNFRLNKKKRNLFFTAKNKNLNPFLNNNNFKKNNLNFFQIFEKNKYHNDHCKEENLKIKFFDYLEKSIERAGVGVLAGIAGSVANPFTWEGMLYCCPVHWSHIFAGALTGMLANQIFNDFDYCFKFIFILFFFVFLLYVIPNYKYFLKKIEEKRR